MVDQSSVVAKESMTRRGVGWANTEPLAIASGLEPLATASGSVIYVLIIASRGGG